MMKSPDGFSIDFTGQELSSPTLAFPVFRQVAKPNMPY
jgi:hypothetical protein